MYVPFFVFLSIVRSLAAAFIWGVRALHILSVLPFLLCAVGGFVMLRERRVLCSPRALFSPLRTSDLREKKKIRTTLILALSGTLGVGNITGVAASLILGGAGSVFWMLLSTPFAIALKYAESSISISRGNGEGIPGVLKNTLGNRTGKHLSHLYLFLF